MSKRSSLTVGRPCPVTGQSEELHEAIDLRAARSRSAIRQAFLTLIAARGYDAVGVKAICARAGVSRTTFYAHFAGKDDLKRHGVDHMRRQIEVSVGSITGAAPPFAFSFALFEHAKAHLRLYRGLAGSRGGAIALEALREVLLTLVKADLVRRRTAVAGRSLAIRYYVGAFMGVLTWWLEAGAKSSPAEVDAAFRALAE